MIGCCTACSRNFETTEEDANTPGTRCPGCYFLLRAFELLASAQAELGRAWQQDPTKRTPRLAEAVSLMERAAHKLRKEANP